MPGRIEHTINCRANLASGYTVASIAVENTDRDRFTLRVQRVQP